MFNKIPRKALACIVIVVGIVLYVILVKIPKLNRPVTTSNLSNIATLSNTPKTNALSSTDIVNISVSTTASNSHLTTDVSKFYLPEKNIDKLFVQMLGAELGDFNSSVGNGMIDENAGEAFKRGLATGVQKGISDETNKKNAILALYFKCRLSPSITSPRDVLKGSFPISVIDNKKDKGDLLYNSLSDNYLEINKEKYGIVLFAVYSDSKYFEIKIGDTQYKLFCSQLSYMKK